MSPPRRSPARGCGKPAEAQPRPSGPRASNVRSRQRSFSAAATRARSLVVGYGGRPVLSDVSIEVRAGEVLCVIGHNGAGKSTLMRTLFGLTRPVSGQILVDGKELAHHVPRALAAHGVALMPEGRGI